ncbi:MAG TPA: hypothetical protein VE377_16260 [Candidatus Dormibacteraeota bacterium]|nr:hypothetical protein [Candidatus Dormibacteraeota bacterium]
MRVTSASSPEHLVYCCSQRLSENGVDEITKIAKRHIPSGSLTVYGSIQLGRFAEKHGEIFGKFYHAELESIRAAFERKPDEEESKRGLRLALVTIGSEGAGDLKDALLRHSILEVLSETSRASVVAIADEISKDLGLPRPLQATSLSEALASETQRATIRLTAVGYEITDLGRTSLKEVPATAAEFLLQGRVAIRGKIQDLIGYSLADKQFDQLWSVMLDFLSGLFYQNGLAVIKAIDAFMGGETPQAEQDLRELIKQGAHRAAVASSATPDGQIVLETAIADTFVEREGPAFEWLIRVGERFVSLCCLGLESTTAEQVRETLVSNRLVLDSDIVLTYLCPSSPDNSAVRDLLGRWLEIKGKILLAPVVLEEVAYHAWISENDFRETRYLFGKLRPEERSRYIRNAFVAAFHATGAPASQWDVFVGQYKGNSEGDYRKIQNILRASLFAEVLPENYDPKLAGEITNYLMRAGAYESELSDLDEDAHYKRGRDGRLLASLAAARTAAEALPEHSSFLLLSSSKGLRRAERKFTERLGGEPRIVLSRASFAYLLSLVPNVRLGADSLRRALFEFGMRAKLPDTQRRALRMIKGAGFELHWAGRPLLQQQLNRSIHVEARKRGITDEAISKRIATGSDPTTSAEIISDALRSLASDTVTEKELQLTKKRVQELEAELRVARSAVADKETGQGGR